MTFTNIPEIHGRSNQHYSVELSPCHGGELRGLCQLPIHPIAHQYGIGARRLHAFEAALRVPHSVLQDEAVGLQISILLQQAEPVFFPWTSGAYGKCVPKGCWPVTDVTLGELSPPLALRRRRYSCSQGLGRNGPHRERDTARH
jgi:hypothetical protein